MPKLKDRTKPMTRLINGYIASAAELGRVLECSDKTARKKRDCPDALTLEDLARLNAKGHIPADEIRAAVLR